MVKNRIFFDIEKENEWLNQMASKGFRFIGKSWYTYKFEKCECNAYAYQVEKRSTFKGKENKEYSDFLSELGIKLATEQWGWYYFEKHNDGKPFEIYTDIPSKVKYYTRMFPVLMLIGMINVSIINSHLAEPTGPWILNISVSYVSNIVCLLAVVAAAINYGRRILSLKRQEDRE